MPDRVPVRRALISVSDKTDLVPFARALVSRGVEIISTGGTARALTDAGVDVTSIDQITGFPEIMGGRVKTLHPKVHGGLLARRDDDDHIAAMREHGIEPIDLVCVSLYPFERTARDPGSNRDEIIEQIDIGGPSMIRSAAKNHDFVTVVTSPTQYDRIINELNSNDGATTSNLRQDLAAAAFSRTAEYDATIAAWMHRRQAANMPDQLRFSYTKTLDLRYGENPHQRAALYRDPASRGPTVVGADVLHGKPLSYNNLNDAAAALAVVRDLDRPAFAVIKHLNPCGCAVADELPDAFDGAYEGDPLAAFGGILATNRIIDRATAERIANGDKFFEVIVAVRFEPDALELLRTRWKNVRLLAVGDHEPSPYRKLEYRSIPGGMLVQDQDIRKPTPHEWRHAAGPEPTEARLADAIFAWTVCKHLRSNAVAIVKDGCLVGAGMGQVDRVTACHLAAQRAGDRASEAVAASDAFFPFADGPAALTDAGVDFIVQPGGSKRDEETIDLCREREVTLMLTGVRHFRH